MRPIDVIEGKVSVLDRNDVDTDQIIPKQFLKRVERTGFGEFLFYDWIRDGEIELEPNPILVAGRNFGCGSRASTRRGRWRTSASRRSSHPPSPTSSTPTARRSALPAIVDEAHCKRIAEAGEARIDVDDETIDCGPPASSLRGRAGRQAPAAERPRRHRHHPAERGRDRRVTRDFGPCLRAGDDEHLMAPRSRRPATGTPATYQRIAVPHEDWARALIERLPLAGCGDRARRRLRHRPVTTAIWSSACRRAR